MPIRIFNDFERPSSADFNRYFMQQDFRIKPSNEIVNNSSSQQNDDHLVIPVDANTAYWVLGVIFYDSSTTADFRVSWIAPAGANFVWGFDGMPNSASTFINVVSRSLNSVGGVIVAGGAGVGTVGCIIPKGLLRTSSAGTLQFRWSQGTAEATNTTVRANSILIIRRLTS